MRRSWLNLQAVWRFWFIWQRIRRQIWHAKRWVTWRQMGSLRELESSFIDITNTAIFILGVIHSRVLDGFISDEGWATIYTHTTFQLSHRGNWSGDFYHVHVQDTPVEPVPDLEHNRQVCIPSVLWQMCFISSSNSSSKQLVLSHWSKLSLWKEICLFPNAFSAQVGE